MLQIIAQLLRWPNLIIIALTQYLLKYAVFYPAYQQAGVAFSLNDGQYACLVLFTMLTAGGGYIINDIYDCEIDLINKPYRVIIGKTISLKQAWALYWLSFLISLAAAAWLYPKFPTAIPIILASYLMLWLYSYSLKKMPLWGNLTVAIFCAIVPLLVWLAEVSSFETLEASNPNSASQISAIMVFYAPFAFLSTLYREVVKDMEDIEGDKLYGCHTLPIKYGIKYSKTVALIAGGLVAAAFFAWFLGIRQQLNWWGTSYGIIAIAAPTIYSLYLLLKAESPEQFGKISSLIKKIMLLGLLYLPVLLLLN